MIKPINFKALEMVQYALAKWLDVEVRQLDMDFILKGLAREKIQVCDWEDLEDWLFDEAEKYVDEVIENIDHYNGSLGNTKVSSFLIKTNLQNAFIIENRKRIELDFEEVYVEVSQAGRDYLDGSYYINTSLLKEFGITKREFLLDKGDTDETV